ncbi:MAG TPA: VOC family protein [Ignavibacteriaceae bacterium]|nr:VOC family protein [Ignavibacteriaceae bacterium]
MAVKHVPEGYHTVTPYLLVKNASDFLVFLKKAFDAKEKDIAKGPDGTIMHAVTKIGDSFIMLGEATGKFPAMPTMLYLYVKNTDETYKNALKAGAVSDMEPKDMFWGDRNAGVRDQFGNYWSIATHIKDVTREEMEAGMKDMMKETV